MSNELGVASSNERQLVVGIFLICAGLGSLVPGSVADRFGRRPVLLVCLACYISLTLACALVQDFTTLLVLRGLIGFTTAGLSIMPAAIIRDKFDGDRMARLQSLVSMVFMIVPMIAPSLGQAVELVAGWRWIFGVMAFFCGIMIVWVWLRLPETLHPEFRQPIRPAAIAGNMRDSIANRASVGYVFGMALMQAAMFGYINSSQQLVA
jgi:MFS transporter, DHA1 family, multidrug resistance protein